MINNPLLQIYLKNLFNSIKNTARLKIPSKSVNDALKEKFWRKFDGAI